MSLPDTVTQRAEGNNYIGVTGMEIAVQTGFCIQTGFYLTNSGNETMLMTASPLSSFNSVYEFISGVSEPLAIPLGATRFIPFNFKGLKHVDSTPDNSPYVSYCDLSFVSEKTNISDTTVYAGQPSDGIIRLNITGYVTGYYGKNDLFTPDYPTRFVGVTGTLDDLGKGKNSLYWNHPETGYYFHSYVIQSSTDAGANWTDLTNIEMPFENINNLPITGGQVSLKLYGDCTGFAGEQYKEYDHTGLPYDTDYYYRIRGEYFLYQDTGNTQLTGSDWIYCSGVSAKNNTVSSDVEQGLLTGSVPSPTADIALKTAAKGAMEIYFNNKEEYYNYNDSNGNPQTTGRGVSLYDKFISEISSRNIQESDFNNYFTGVHFILPENLELGSQTTGYAAVTVSGNLPPSNFYMKEGAKVFGQGGNGGDGGTLYINYEPPNEGSEEDYQSQFIVLPERTDDLFNESKSTSGDPGWPAFEIKSSVDNFSIYLNENISMYGGGGGGGGGDRTYPTKLAQSINTINSLYNEVISEAKEESDQAQAAAEAAASAQAAIEEANRLNAELQAQLDAANIGQVEEISNQSQNPAMRPRLLIPENVIEDGMDGDDPNEPSFDFEAGRIVIQTDFGTTLDDVEFYFEYVDQYSRIEFEDMDRFSFDQIFGLHYAGVGGGGQSYGVSYPGQTNRLEYDLAFTAKAGDGQQFDSTPTFTKVTSIANETLIRSFGSIFSAGVGESAVTEDAGDDGAYKSAGGGGGEWGEWGKTPTNDLPYFGYGRMEIEEVQADAASFVPENAFGGGSPGPALKIESTNYSRDFTDTNFYIPKLFKFDYAYAPEDIYGFIARWDAENISSAGAVSTWSASVKTSDTTIIANGVTPSLTASSNNPNCFAKPASSFAEKTFNPTWGFNGFNCVEFQGDEYLQFNNLFYGNGNKGLNNNLNGFELFYVVWPVTSYYPSTNPDINQYYGDNETNFNWTNLFRGQNQHLPRDDKDQFSISDNHQDSIKTMHNFYGNGTNSLNRFYQNKIIDGSISYGIIETAGLQGGESFIYKPNFAKYHSGQKVGIDQGFKYLPPYSAYIYNVSATKINEETLYYSVGINSDVQVDEIKSTINFNDDTVIPCKLGSIGVTSGKASFCISDLVFFNRALGDEEKKNVRLFLKKKAFRLFEYSKSLTTGKTPYYLSNATENNDLFQLSFNNKQYDGNGLAGPVYFP